MLAAMLPLLLAPIALAALPVLSPPNFTTRRFVLDNGLEVVLHEDHRAPLVASHIFYRVGASEDPPGRSGLAHLFEHLMFGGSKHAPDSAYDRLLAEVGGDNNAWTDEDYTAYHAVVPRGALGLLLFLESDRMGWLVEGLSDEEIENQLLVVAGERGIGEDAPGGQDGDLIDRALYPAGHPYGRPVIGFEDELASVTRAELAEFHARWYAPANASLVLVGDFDSDAAEAEVRRWFGDLPTRPAPPPRALPPLVELSQERRVKHEDDVERSSLYVVWPTVPEGHPDEAPLDMLADLLSSGPGSRLDDALYFDRRRADAVSAWTTNGRVSGAFTIELQSARRDLDDLLRDLDRVLDALRRSAPAPSELERQKTRWRSWFFRAGEDLADRAEQLDTCLVTTGGPACHAQDLALHEAVTPADVSRVLERWLPKGRRLLLSVVAPEHGRRALQGSLPVALR